MDTSKNTYMYCRCNECGSVISYQLNIFGLNGHPLSLKCEVCGQSEFTAELTRTRGVNLKVPCLYCKGEHRYPLSSPTFFGKDLFLLQCPLTGYDTCMIGTDIEKVNNAFEENDAELKKLIMETQTANASGEKLGESLESRGLTEAFEEIIAAVNTFVADKRYACDCEKRPSPSELCMTVDGVNIEIKCKICGAAETVNIADPDDVDRFIDSGMIDMWK